MRNRTQQLMVGAAGVIALLAGQALGQCDWSGPGVSGPEPRNGPRLAYDSVRHRTVMFGGFVGTLFSSTRPDTTWEWDGSNWAQTASTGPGGRAYPCMAYDSTRHATVLFGGTAGAVQVNDTWTYDGTLWTQASPAAAPPIRNAAALCFDSGRGVAVLFGGLNSPTRYNDTWEWDGTNWTQRSPGVAGDPAVRHFAGFAYDSARGVCVLFGGNGATGNLGDTWEWNGAAGTWTQRASTGPSARSQMGFAYDSMRHVSVLFGGPSGTATNETWEWDGTTWTQATPLDSPQARYNVGMAYDSGLAQTVLYGGQLNGSPATVASDTWLLACSPPPPPCYANCDGSTTTPLLNVSDFTCFLQKFAQGNSYANCDGSTSVPVLNVADFTCFLQKFAQGCP
jgi:Galactose oxidase, central domain